MYGIKEMELCKCQVVGWIDNYILVSKYNQCKISEIQKYLVLSIVNKGYWVCHKSGGVGHFFSKSNHQQQLARGGRIQTILGKEPYGWLLHGQA
jgi:hypothetical protein